MRTRRTTTWTVLVACGVLCGCGRSSDQQRLKILVPNASKTTPVSGTVYVDGKPMKDVWVKLHPEHEQPDSLIPKAQTQDDGSFKITTYIGGDGAPQGTYKVTVEWLTFQPFGSQWVGPNKVLDKYGDVKTTPFDVAVANKPVALQKFEVEAKSAGELEKSKKPPSRGPKRRT